MAFSPAFPPNLLRPAALRCVALTAAAGLALTFGLASNADAAASPLLGPTASTFGVLGHTQVTNAGNSVVSGNVGVSPGTSLTGFPPGQINNGSEEVNTGPAVTAQAELTASMLALAAPPTTSTTSDLGGRKLVPGVYESPGILSLNGTVTLDGGGKSDSVFIFRAGSGLTVTQSSVVKLINGANACNVFWRVNSTATINHDADFTGTVEALASINVFDAATVHGRLLASTAMVSLINDTITAPTNCTTPTGGGGSGGSGGSSSTPDGGSGTTPPLGASNGTPPTVTGVTPDHGTTAGGTTVTVTGSGFTTTGTLVKVGGKTIPSSQVTVHSPTRLTFTTGPHTPGTTTFTVTTPNGTSHPHTFTYTHGRTTTTVLAATGSENGQLLGIAALLVLAGGGVLMVAKRGSRRPTH